MLKNSIQELSSLDIAGDKNAASMVGLAGASRRTTRPTVDTGSDGLFCIEVMAGRSEIVPDLKHFLSGCTA
jgi:hypothetical protein